MVRRPHERLTLKYDVLYHRKALLAPGADPLLLNGFARMPKLHYLLPGDHLRQNEVAVLFVLSLLVF